MEDILTESTKYKISVVLSGLAAGDEIVTNGVFAVDASAQLKGKPSMMNQHEGPEQNE